MTEWLDDLHASRKIISDVANNLQGIGSALWRVGNPILGDKLESLANYLVDAEDLLETGTNKVSSENYTIAMQGTGNMLDAVLMMCEREGEQEQELAEAREQGAGSDQEVKNV